ncbi:MAG: hypothetical protein ACLQRM_11185 [Acidimicrobiales bacterium]
MSQRLGAHRRLLAGALSSLAGVSLVALLTVPASPAAWAVTATPKVHGNSMSSRAAQINQFGTSTWSLRGLGPVWMSSPVVATIDNVKAVVLGTLSGEIYVVNARTGTELPGWPQFVHINSQTPTAIDSSPAVAYLDGPNKPPSIIVGAGSLWRRDQQGGLEAFYANGKVRFVFQTQRTFNPWGTGSDDYSDPVFATPAVGDITGTGQLDIVFGSYDHYIYALQPNGHLVPGFPINRADTIWSSPTLVDTSHTGRDDIIMGGDASGFYGCRGGWLVDYRYVSSTPELVWQRCTGQTIWSSPTVGILNSTGRPAVVVGTSYYSGYHSAATDEILAVYADDGSDVPGWPVTAAGPTFGSPAIGRIDGQEAVVATSCARCLDGPAVVSAWNGSGHRIWSTVFDAHNEATSSPVLVDLTGGRDDGDDVLIGAAWGLYLLSGRNGSFLYNTGAWASTLDMGCDAPSSAAVAYVPGAPKTGWMLYNACGGPTVPATLYAYPFPVAPVASNPPAWPEWRANADRTGIADPQSVSRTSCGPISPHLVGYRLVASDGAVFERGNLPFCGGLNSSVLPSTVVSMASTPDGRGYWLLLADGSVYAFGNATWFGDLRGSTWRGGPVPPGAPVVAMAATPDGQGYFVLGGDGSVYAFGDARYHGSRGAKWSNGAVVGIAVDSATGGYWLVTSRGAVYGEDAPDYGSASKHPLTSPIVAIAAAPDGDGYWLAAQDGEVYSYGAASHGTAAPGRLGSPVIGIAANPSGKGFWLATAAGTIICSKRSGSYGEVPKTAHSEPITAFSSAP